MQGEKPEIRIGFQVLQRYQRRPRLLGTAASHRIHPISLALQTDELVERTATAGCSDQVGAIAKGGPAKESHAVSSERQRREREAPHWAPRRQSGEDPVVRHKCTTEQWWPYVVIVLVAGALGCDRLSCRGGADGGSRASVRISMEALHQAGGVPPGWRFSPPRGDPSAGKQAFIDFGCHTCHAVRGEQFPEASGDSVNVGPELTGMGSHHPPEYFAESILNPNAVLVDGPGYSDTSGRSIMPEYPDMTLAELANLVAYLQSLRSGGGQDAHMHHHAGSPGGGSPPAAAYMIQVEEATSEELRAFNTWFVTEGARTLAQDDGVSRFDSYVNRSADPRVFIAVFGFDDEGAMNRWAQRPDAAARPGGLLGSGSRIVYRSPLVYKTVGLSIP
jgi:mono/diheme cytochrome c family protein